MPEKTTPLSALEQHLLKARTTVGAEMPDVADAPIEPMGWLDRLIAKGKEKLVGPAGGSVAALADPHYRPGGGAGVGRVVYSPEVLSSQNPSEIEDILAHELVHVRQGRDADQASGGLFGRVKAYIESIKHGRLPYGQQPDELEAYQYEGDRAVRQGRVPSATPNFLSPGLREMGNIYLPKEK